MLTRHTNRSLDGEPENRCKKIPAKQGASWDYPFDSIGYTGLEPVNYGFRVRCLTNLANTQ